MGLMLGVMASSSSPHTRVLKPAIAASPLTLTASSTAL
jgi:hypothetical protein